MKCKQCGKQMKMIQNVIINHNREIITIWKCHFCGFAFRERIIMKDFSGEK